MKNRADRLTLSSTVEAAAAKERSKAVPTDLILSQCVYDAAIANGPDSVLLSDPHFGFKVFSLSVRALPLRLLDSKNSKLQIMSRENEAHHETFAIRPSHHAIDIVNTEKGYVEVRIILLRARQNVSLITSLPCLPVHLSITRALSTHISMAVLGFDATNHSSYIRGGLHGSSRFLLALHSGHRHWVRPQSPLSCKYPDLCIKFSGSK
jgi:hypothetical protein